jgi:hypothetical protein
MSPLSSKAPAKAAEGVALGLLERRGLRLGQDQALLRHLGLALCGQNRPLWGQPDGNGARSTAKGLTSVGWTWYQVSDKESAS